MLARGCRYGLRPEQGLLGHPNLSTQHRNVIMLQKGCRYAIDGGVEW
jgi:hypothetical protein